MAFQCLKTLPHLVSEGRCAPGRFAKFDYFCSVIGKPGQWALYNRFFDTQNLADTVVLHDVISFEQIFSQPFRRLW